jgi:DNA-binding NarL/FixJ family response regulator
MIRVAIADDHPIVRDGIRRLLASQPDIQVVAEAADGADVVHILQTWPCEVLILDLSLPHLQGLELVKLVRSDFPLVAVVVFTMQREDVLGRSLVAAGVSGYVRKDRPLDELLRAVRRAAAGQRDLPPTLAGAEAASLPRGSAPHLALSAREAQVFYRMAAGFQVKDIALELEISASTASNHVARIREKLGLRTNGEVVLYASQHGLLG